MPESLGQEDVNIICGERPIDLRSCNYEFELREKVLTSKRILLRNFFSCYLKSTYEVNANLNVSYLEKLREEYRKLPNCDKFNFNDMRETIEEMEVDETAKEQIYDMLSQYTNCSTLIKSSGEQSSTKVENKVHASSMLEVAMD